jgi:hypothetical protein
MGTGGRYPLKRAQREQSVQATFRMARGSEMRRSTILCGWALNCLLDVASLKGK